MVQASRIRFGHWTQLVWWDADKTRRPLRQLAADTGVYAFEVSPTKCQRLLTYLEDPGSYSKDGFLKLAGTTWPGYNNYGLVHAVGGVDTHFCRSGSPCAWAIWSRWTFCSNVRR